MAMMISAVQCYVQDYVSEGRVKDTHGEALQHSSQVWLEKRESIMNWLFDWGEQLGQSSHCIQQACVLSDLFISSRHIDTPEVFQLIVGLALNITAKLDSQFPLTLAELSQAISCPLSPAALSKVELLMLDTVGWRVAKQTAAGMSRLLLQVTCPEFNFQTLWKYSDAFAALCYCNSELAKNDACTIAVATVCAALDKLNQRDFKESWLAHIKEWFSPSAVSLLLSRIQKLVSHLEEDRCSDSTEGSLHSLTAEQ